jgi:hypothetical protein
MMAFATLFLLVLSIQPISSFQGLSTFSPRAIRSDGFLFVETPSSKSALFVLSDEAEIELRVLRERVRGMEERITLFEKIIEQRENFFLKRFYKKRRKRPLSIRNMLRMSSQARMMC